MVVGVPVVHYMHSLVLCAVPTCPCLYCPKTAILTAIGAPRTVLSVCSKCWWAKQLTEYGRAQNKSWYASCLDYIKHFQWLITTYNAYDYLLAVKWNTIVSDIDRSNWMPLLSILWFHLMRSIRCDEHIGDLLILSYRSKATSVTAFYTDPTHCSPILNTSIFEYYSNTVIILP